MLDTRVASTWPSVTAGAVNKFEAARCENQRARRPALRTLVTAGARDVTMARRCLAVSAGRTHGRGDTLMTVSRSRCEDPVRARAHSLGG